MITEADLFDLGQFMINELGKELITQNHRATGKLIQSLDFSVSKSVESTDLLIFMNDYGEWINTGRKKGAKKVPIPALVEWIKQKGIATGNKKILGIAFAIQKTIEKEGIPTVRRRQRFGKSIEFVDDTIERVAIEINRRVTEIASRDIEVMLDNFVKIR